MSKREIERLLVAELHTFPDCDKALHIDVVPIEDCTNTATWTVSRFNHGKSCGEACERIVNGKYQRGATFNRQHPFVDIQFSDITESEEMLDLGALSR